MKVAKTCRYKTTVYNLLPTVLLTPLYDNVPVSSPSFQPLTLADALRWPSSTGVLSGHWYHAGFRLAFKFACFHVGIEVHYE